MTNLKTNNSNINKSFNKEEENKMTNQNVIALTKVEIEIRKSIENLKSKQAVWSEHQKIADNLLYVLIEECVDFYKFLNKDEKNLDAFKNVALVKFRHRTKVYNVLAQLIFGKTKQTYAYGKAINLAFTNGIGDNGKITVLQWLQDNGGVNGVIRESGSDTTEQKKHYYDIACNYQHYLPNVKLPKVNGNNFTKNLIGKQIVIIGKVNENNEIQLLTSGVCKEALLTDVLVEEGKMITQTEEYKKNAYEAEKKVTIEKKQAEEKIVKELEKIGSKAEEMLKKTG